MLEPRSLSPGETAVLRIEFPGELAPANPPANTPRRVTPRRLTDAELRDIEAAMLDERIRAERERLEEDLCKLAQLERQVRFEQLPL